MEAPETIMNRHETEWLDLRRMDNMELMAQFPDKHFDLAIVDPPYGINAASDKRGGKQHGAAAAPSKSYGEKAWDSEIPSAEYFDEIRRVSRHQIIWGGNYFSLTPSRCWVVWDKLNGDNGYADCELAWASFDKAVRKFEFRWAGMLQGDMANKENRIHPTQKPVALYRWLLANYAKPGQKILDTHLGSMSSVIACIEAGFHITGCELDEDYFNAGIARVKKHLEQQTFPFLKTTTLPSCGMADKRIEDFQVDLPFRDNQTTETA